VIEFDTGPALVAFIENTGLVSVGPEDGERGRIERCQPKESAMRLHPKAVEESLKKSLEAALPKYTVPSAFLSVRKIPMTVSQKIDRLALKRLGREVCLRQRSVHTTKERLPRASKSENSTEAYLVQQWEDILRLDSGSLSSSSSNSCLLSNAD